MSSTPAMQNPSSWQLRGKPFRVALFVGIFLVVGALLAGAYDLASPIGRRQLPLDLAALAGRVVIVVGLAALARRDGSLSMALLAALAALLAAAGSLADAEFVDRVVGAVGDMLARLFPLSDGVAHVGLLFVALGLAALGFLGAAWIKARPGERQVIGVLILLFVTVGVFTGPVNAIAVTGINPEWLFAEDFGQAIVLAVMAGYVAGLAATPRKSR